MNLPTRSTNRLSRLATVLLFVVGTHSCLLSTMSAFPGTRSMSCMQAAPASVKAPSCCHHVPSAAAKHAKPSSSCGPCCQAIALSAALDADTPVLAAIDILPLEAETLSAPRLFAMAHLGAEGESPPLLALDYS